MNCNYMKLLTDGDAGMVCRHCKKPIRTKNKTRADRIRLLLVLIPIFLFCIIAGTDISSMPYGKAAIVACFLVFLGISIFGWLIACRCFIEYEEVPEKTDDNNIPEGK